MACCYRHRRVTDANTSNITVMLWQNNTDDSTGNRSLLLVLGKDKLLQLNSTGMLHINLTVIMVSVNYVDLPCTPWTLPHMIFYVIGATLKNFLCSQEKLWDRLYMPGQSLVPSCNKISKKKIANLFL